MRVIKLNGLLGDSRNIVQDDGVDDDAFWAQDNTNTQHDIQNDNSTETGRNTDENHSFKDEVKKWDAFN